ncbi:hypothetical protein ACLBXO_22790 [Methylobacterium sp. C33D]|uniref:hypothetical protein n=1 Tax=Methylobacterium mesophilicum TaxID=39956 RepID=UPI002F35DD8B
MESAVDRPDKLLAGATYGRISRHGDGRLLQCPKLFEPKGRIEAACDGRLYEAADEFVHQLLVECLQILNLCLSTATILTPSR